MADGTVPGAIRGWLEGLGLAQHAEAFAAQEIDLEALADVTFRPPLVPVVANVAATAVTDPTELRRLLVEQVTAMVRWRESVQYMIGQGVESFVELGAGKVLGGLVKRIDREARGQSVGTPAAIDEFLGSL